MWDGRRRIAILWALFLVRGAFYCTMMPLWEGWDEYAHFAVLQHWLDHASLPRFDDPISREIDESMRLAPLPDELSWIGPPYLTHQQWWALPAAEREDRERRLATLPPSWARQPSVHPFLSYEAQQPPLYYWIASQPLRPIASRPLLSRVLWIRLFSLIIASFAIPLTWLAARSVVGEDGALFCAALLAVAPGFAIDTSRIANDCLAIALMALLLWLLTSPAARERWILTGVALGAALLAKAYLLALIPAVATVGLRQKPGLRKKCRLALVLAMAFAVAGWWYVGNVAVGHGLTHWLDRADTGAVLRAAPRINWLSAADIVAKSFVWFGGWSFLTLKSWMYTAIEAIALMGVVLALGSRNRKLTPLWVLSACYLLAIAYGVLVYFTVHRIPNLPGWYLWPMAGTFSMIVVAGLRRASMLLISMMAALDLYGVMALLTPFYAGLVEHNRADASQFLRALVRLRVPLPIAILWVAATIAIPIASAWPKTKRRPRLESEPPSESPL
jgi:4-amino-4-deoxy-L-arabinose transferase-like glycosyltransferase